MNNNFNPLSAEELTSRINKIPRVNLAQLPTVLEFAPNISKELGINLYIKRDDCTALAFGGNKTRHLEFIMAKTLSGDYDCILTGAASQSNFCRQAVAAANKLNLDSYLVLMHGIKGNLMQGNFLLYNILGANVDVIDGENLEEIPKHLDIKYNELIKEGRKPLLIYGGFGKEDTTLAGISYANAMAEIDLQNLEDKIKVLDEDIQKVNELLVKLEKDKVNALATMNALQGAKSQCVTLVKELHNDEDQSSGSSDDS